jgi:WD40 repeat protein
VRPPAGAWLAVLVLLGTAATRSAAQAPPGSDIFVAPLRTVGDSLVVGAPRNVTDRPGYDNQPSFTSNGRSLLFVSIRADGQADVYRYDLESGATTRVTRTAESEFSPTPMMGDSTLSVVRVERDSTQRLWSFTTEGEDPRLLLDNLKPVGYHAWSDAGHVALFILGEPHRLQFADLSTGLSDTLAGNIGRCLQRIPGGNAISFVQKVSDTEWWIMKFNPATHEISRLTTTLPGVEDYAWIPDGRLLAARDMTLYVCRPASREAQPAEAATPAPWTAFRTFSLPSVTSLTRLTVSPGGDRLAMVGLERGTQ